VELGRKGGRKRGHTKRAHGKNGDAPTREGRERLRQEFESDADFYAKVKAAYEDALEAVTTCPSCKERALPNHPVRLAAGDSVMAQIYGKPQQNIQQKTDVTIHVVSRTREALEEMRRKRADVTLDDGAVRELPEAAGE
jgi:tRNA A37 N6-isopentenylltransferase MiaA